MPRRSRAATVAAAALRATALGATLLVLVATSPPDQRCDKWVAPLVVRAQGTCGPGGVVVLDASEFSNTLTISNGAALGLPPSATGTYDAAGCPSNPVGGGWKVRFGEPPDAACNHDDAGQLVGGCTTTCTVEPVTEGTLQFACATSDGARMCESTLTVLE